MIGDIYIKLGSGKAGKHHAGGKGAMLDRAARAGIPVPRGVLLLDTAWDQAVLKGLMTIRDGKVGVADPHALMRFLGLSRFNFRRPLAFRSAFSAEDTDEQSMAGTFETVLFVPPDDPVQQAQAIKRVLESAAQYQGRFRRDLLIMEMVEAQHAGVAFTEYEHEDDLINYTEGTAQDLLAGRVEGESMLLAKLRGLEKRLPGERLEPWQNRLQRLLKAVRHWLDSDDWDIEWADNGKTCYLLQVRPITRPTRRKETFSIAHYKEVLPELPSTFMSSLIESCSRELFEYYREFDSSLPVSRHFVRVFKGRTYVNLSLMSEMTRRLGLPTQMVTNVIGGQVDRPYPANPLRLIGKTLNWKLPRFFFAQLNAVRHARRSTVEVLRQARSPGEGLSELIDTLRWLYIKLVHEMFNLTAAIGPQFALLRNLGVLDEHEARHTTIASRIYTELEPLHTLVARHADLLPPLERGELPDDDAFYALWEDYIMHYGHRGIFESDIARPRFRDDPAPLLKSLTLPPGKRQRIPPRTFTGLLTLPLWWHTGRAIRTREHWRHDVMHAMQRVRDALLRRAQNLVRRGILPEADSLWLLTVDEVRALDEGWQPEAGFFQERKRERQTLKGYHLPDLVQRFEDLEVYREDVAYQRRVRMAGISLTNGQISGTAWVLDEPETELPEGFEQDDTILIARSVDAGWIPTFSRVAGVVVETGGDLSHGSIILREIGLPAVTGVQGVTQAVRTGDPVTLDARVGILQIDEDQEELMRESAPMPAEGSSPRSL